MRRVEAMLPDAEIVFLDEIFKSNSAILNSLLSILNERRFFTGSASIQVPLSRCSAPPTRSRTTTRSAPIFDRFLVRALSDNLDSFHFHGLIERGLARRDRELRRRRRGAVEGERGRWCRWPRSASCKRRLPQLLHFPEEFLARYKGLVFQIRSEGVTLSDRRVVKLLKLFAASALVDGRPTVDDGDFFVLRHVWNSLDQIALLEDIVDPVLERHRREHPEERARRRERRAISTASWPSWASSASSCSAASRSPTCSCSPSCATCRRSARRCRRSAPTRRSRWRARSTSCSRACSSRRSGTVERPGAFAKAPARRPRSRASARAGAPREREPVRRQDRSRAAAAARVLDAGRAGRAGRRGRGGAHARQAATTSIRRSRAR